jgi:hypothetical protein
VLGQNIIMHKNYFKPPFKFWFGATKVFTSDEQLAFDFVPKMIEPDAYEMSLEDKQGLIDIINGAEKKITNDFNFKYECGTIFLNEKPFIWIRSWGRLTGQGGGLGLSTEEAIKIQESFANFIIEKLEASIVR